MQARLQIAVGMLVVVSVWLAGAGGVAGAKPAPVTVTPYADLVRFTAQSEVREWQVQILSLSGQQLFDSGWMKDSSFDWQMQGAHGAVAGGVYLYTVTAKNGSSRVSKQLGKLALLRGRGGIAPPLISTPRVSNPEPVQPNWTGCANPCADVHQGNLTIQTTGAVSWSFFDAVNQRLGIGTTSPGVSLEVLSNTGIRVTPTSNTGSALLFLRSANTPGTGTGHSDLQFYDGSTLGFRFLAAFGNGAGNRYGGLIALSDRDGNKLPIRLFTTNAADSLVDTLFLQAGANAGIVGIGTTSPCSSAKLHVFGASSGAICTLPTAAIYGESSSGAGVRGASSGFVGVFGESSGGGTGVTGTSSSGTGVLGQSVTSSTSDCTLPGDCSGGYFTSAAGAGANSSAVFAENTSTGSGIALWGRTHGSDAAFVLDTIGGFAPGDFIRAFNNVGSLQFQVTNSGKAIAAGGFNGTCRTDGNVTGGPICNQGVAEAYASAEPTEAGDVVVLVSPAGMVETPRLQAKRSLW